MTIVDELTNKIILSFISKNLSKKKLNKQKTPRPINTCFKNKANLSTSIFFLSDLDKVLYPAIRSGCRFTKKPHIIRILLTKS